MLVVILMVPCNMRKQGSKATCQSHKTRKGLPDPLKFSESGLKEVAVEEDSVFSEAS